MTAHLFGLKRLQSAQELDEGCEDDVRAGRFEDREHVVVRVVKLSVHQNRVQQLNRLRGRLVNADSGGAEALALGEEVYAILFTERKAYNEVSKYPRHVPTHNLASGSYLHERLSLACN